jgi:hypothetical protein
VKNPENENWMEYCPGGRKGNAHCPEVGEGFTAFSARVCTITTFTPGIAESVKAVTVPVIVPFVWPAASKPDNMSE